MSVTTVDIKKFARFLVLYANHNDLEISNLKLQKLLYYIQAYHLTYFDKHPLFNDEPEAWVRGPVYRKIYGEYKAYESEDIILEVDDLEKEYQNALDDLKLTDNQTKFIQSALDYFGQKSPIDLVIRSHAEKPWNEARKGYGELDSCNEKITHEMMFDYYSKVSSRN